MRRLLVLLGLCGVSILAGAQPTLADGTPTLVLPDSLVVTVENVASTTVSFPASAVDGLGVSLPITCSPSSGSSFPIGTTAVSCSATDPDSSITTTGGFDVTVQDPTAPTITLPAPPTVNVNGVTSAVVSFAATASDDGSSVPVTCSPDSGTSFSLGVTHVGCSATDGAGNTSTAGFDVTVQDTTPPVLTLPSPITVSVNGVTSKTVTYSATAADGTTTIAPSCTPASGSSFPLATTTVNCSVADGAGNTATGSFTVTVQDTTPPTVSITSGPSGTTNSRNASIAFSSTEGTTSCQLDGGGFSACGSPASLTGLGDGNHTFTVRAADAAANSASASLSWSIDATPPALKLPPEAIVIEADGPTGGNATYTASASDNGTPLPPSAVSCSPKSGTKFPLGDTTVSCSAADSFGNVVHGSFHVIVRDRTPPAINAPNVSVAATAANGIHKTDAALASYLAHVTASDLVSVPTLTNNVPDLLPVGQTTVTFTATDDAGNTAAKRVVITVLPLGTTVPRADLTPPGNPAGIAAKAGDQRVDLSWRTSRDTAYVTVTLIADSSGKAGEEVCRVPAGSCSVKRLQNGTTYRFVLVAWDKAGNRSKGAVVSATPQAELLTAPAQSQRVARPPLLRWAADARASYYNVQLWRGKHKVLSAWPAVGHLQLAATWTFDGRKQKLAPGTYTWYVWPGLGPRAAARYGPLLGSRSFVVVKKLPPL